ncbi:MAG: TIR domain-containing protein [Cyanobacteria bacterium P01_A01_bin.114]
MHSFKDVFVSYGRADSKQFAKRLSDRLVKAGLAVWFDFDDIPLGVDYQNQINDGIEKADNFLFVVSPHSVNSAYCAKEIDLALKYNKRIIPLLHVETIGFETWQRRNPDQAEADWQAYQEKGLHSSFPNMHPEISKINWVYFREELDDFDAGIEGLQSILSRQQRYVRQHTQLLSHALRWQRHHRQAAYLLTGEPRRAAQIWLTKTFEHEQPPCLPTDLQAELITESAQAADGGMTQVFISYAEADSPTKEKVLRYLLRAGITVWTNTVDIRMGENFEAALRRGIEAADTLVYLISTASLSSPYCQQELDYALSLNKRIIPMMLEAVDLKWLKDDLKTIQFINLVDNQSLLDLEQDLARLLRTVRQDAAYYDQHKRLLVRALKWQQQQQNPSLLLRQQALKKYTAWAQIAKERTLQAALPLQLAFLTASQQQPPDQTLDVFLSHHAADIDFSHRLNETLVIQGKRTWFTPEGAEGDADTLDDIHQALDNAENFIFVLSPSSIQSEVCLAELAYAQSRQKRIIPVVYRDMLKASLPEGLESISWRDFRRHDGDFLVNFGELFRVLESDPDHVRSHTRLLVKSMEWDAAHRDDSYLLRGKELAALAQWLKQAINKTPQPTALQRAYIQASQALPFKKIKVRSVMLSTLLSTVVLSVLRLFGGLQPLEMAAYDRFLQLRPSETEQDERLLIVKVDSPSGEWLRSQMVNGRYDPGIGTVPDQALSEAIEILANHDARLIGLDLFRDFPAEGTLVKQLAQTDKLFGICQAASQQAADIPNEIPPARVGFGNLLLDGSKIVRRHYLTHEPNPSGGCLPYEAFSLLLAKTYLSAEGSSYQAPYAEEPIVPLQLGEVTVPRIFGNGTAYSAMTSGLGWSDLYGYQTLLNFWVYRGKLESFAEQVSLDALLRNEVPPRLIRDRIVLIGYTDFSDRNSDDFNTPYGDSIPGVYLHGQMISQLINAVLEDRPLIRWWPFWGETLWILLWSGVGGAIAWRLVRPGRVLAASLGSVGLLTLACYGFLVGPVIWVPWVPALVGWGLAGGAVSYLTNRLRQG